MNLISSFNTVYTLINCIKNKESNVYIRFGDGDFNLIRGENDMLAISSTEITQAYLKTMSTLNCSNLISVNFFCKELGTLEDKMCPGIHEYPYDRVQNFIKEITDYIPNLTTIYSHVAPHHTLCINPVLYATFLQEIQKNKSTIILGNKDFNRDEISFFFGSNIYIGGNDNNSFLERDYICSEFDKVVSLCTDFTVCILALGCGGRAMCHSLIESINKHNKKVLIIDIGSSIDILMGFTTTRAWIEMIKPDVDIIRNILKNNIHLYSNNNNFPIIKQLTSIGMKYNTDKSTYHNYTDFYDSLFIFNKQDIKTLIEIGVAKGDSIKMWREYFMNATIYCYDYNMSQAPDISKLDNVHFLYMDQENRNSIKQGVKDIALYSVDIIIDDGGHFSSQQRNTLEVLWPYLISGGIYIIEDIHTNIKHWYPNKISWNHNKTYWDESPTIFETISKIQLGIPLLENELSIKSSEIKQIILWTQPMTTSALYILIKK
jgi:cephalosporin hydroxylase